GKLITDHFITRLGMAPDTNLVGHGTTGTENGRFHSKKVSRKLLKGIDRGVFPKYIITQWGIVHGC
ncbi:hypothetical protein ABLW56_23180, partial [Salmonella enterica]